MQKAWWKKISFRSITAGVGKLFNILTGAQSAAQLPPPQPVQVNIERPDNTMLIVGIAALAVVLILVMKD